MTNNNHKEGLSIFVDESIHDNLGFIITSFVCSEKDINISVSEALVKANLEPGKDEFKSSSYMSRNPVMQNLRDDLIGLARTKSKLALLISSSRGRKSLGKDALKALKTIVNRNELGMHDTSVFFDRGIVQSEHKGLKIAQRIGMPANLRLHFHQDSKKIMGLQVADALAHLAAQILREEVTGKKKFVDLGGENSGYEKGTTANLGWELLISIRYSFFVRPMIWHDSRDKISLATNPVILTDNDDPATIGIQPDLRGWGVITTSDLDPNIANAVEVVFQKIWLGCIH